MAEPETIVAELQEVLTRHRAALFFGPDNEGELWVDGKCAAHITHGEDCQLTFGSVCEDRKQEVRIRRTTQ